MLNLVVLKTFFLIIFCLGFLHRPKEEEKVKVVDYDKIVEIIQTSDEKSKVLNFWATWCGPCVEEIPFFVKVMNHKAFSNYDFYFISIDEKSDKEKVAAFLMEKGINKNMYLINNIDFNSWINKIDSNWSGSIPMTLVVHSKKQIRHFKETNFKTPKDLELFLTNLNTP